ncbi:hypothetical protein [Streptomyces avermitilis]|uniref:hypothetical protein n=1 Tax=Streptomyces avermitilis TaxID=33903 RepID=UPI00382FA4A5
MLRRIRTQIVSAILLIITWSLTLWCLWYIKDHVHQAPAWLTGDRSFHPSWWSLLYLAVMAALSGLLAVWEWLTLKAGPPTRSIPSVGIPSRVTFLILIALTLILGSSVMIANAVAGWVILGIGVVLVALYVTVAVVSFLSKDADRRGAAFDVLKVLSDVPEPPTDDASGSSPATDPPSSDGASASGAP